jgi:regulator of protease activity HflC (stomatin/prohibitin superfamily)
MKNPDVEGTMYRIKAFDRVLNIQRTVLPRDFRLNPMALLVLAVFVAGGIAWQLLSPLPLGTLGLVEVAGSVLVFALALFLFPSWALTLVFIAALWIRLVALSEAHLWPLQTLTTLGFLLAPGFQIAYHWEKSVILRLGRFHRLRGPGVFLLFPFVDRVTRFVDTRIRATDFSAEKTITMDTVPVHVDALAFWMIWDAPKAVLEVENFLEAVVLSAQTALRDSIGRHELADLLSERERLGKEIQQVLDRKTNPWGITILSIEITDIIIPKELENAMSKRAQAERERQSRVILGTAEIEISEKFVKAAERYKDNPTALHLRAMNMIYEGIKQHGTIVLLPSGALSSMSLSGTLDDLAHGKMQDLLARGTGTEKPGGQDGTQLDQSDQTKEDSADDQG